ncbi:MAG: HU family DNA-binding protein [Phocaeicola sp.]
MAKYIKQEMNDLRKTGEKRAFYRLERAGHMDSEEFVKRVSEPGTGVTDGTVLQVFRHAAYQLAQALAKGYSVTLDGIGTFSATVGVLPDKEMDGLEENEEQRNARSLRLNGVNFRVDSRLLTQASQQCRLERGRVSRLQPSPFSREERLNLAKEYLCKNHFMRIADYMKLTQQSRFTATKELAAFRDEADSGIIAVGNGSSKLYVLRAEE